ncbi:hypothetical protein Golomagni_00740 [Golovinomyces magnicellulatus]|nr:hypothetical protein Golomagni_00740 [Golovinomyces magnicellulatus]
MLLTAMEFPTAIHALQDSRATKAGRNLIICLDGTGDQFDDDNSNVVNFVACLKKDDPQQVTYYQSGIGTYNERGLRGGISAIIDMSIGSGLGIHIKDAYRFLMQNYREGDRICLFGFSRGSYTVRCLAGMLHKVGLLPAHNSTQINFAYNFYKDDSPEGWRMSGDFKKTFCADVNVYFVGIWDCVASVGFIPRKLPFSKSPTNNIGYFRHAMALDEHRSKFKICHYANNDPTAITRPNDSSSRKKGFRNSNGKGLSASCPRAENSESTDKNKTASISLIERILKFPQFGRIDGKNLPGSDSINIRGKRVRLPTDVLEVWFCGGHADVGGGAVKNSERHVLARIPLRWIIRQCFECNTGILFNTAALAETGIDVQNVWPVYKTPTRPVVGPSPNHFNKYLTGVIPPLHRRSTALGLESTKSDLPDEVFPDHEEFEGVKTNEIDNMLPEQSEDYFDAMAPINDQLKLAKGWWLLEMWPVKIRRQKKDCDEWEKVVRFNLGSFRAIRETEPKMHWTVEQRMLDKGYKIEARVHRQAHWKVVV